MSVYAAIQPTRCSSVAAVALLALGLTACSGGGEAGAPADSGGAAVGDPIVVADVGFSTPESVLHDAAADVYLVSNINGGPLDRDYNGFISRVSPDGTVQDLKWIDGAEQGVTLNAPKGMAIQDGILFVADIDCIRMFDATSGAPLDNVCLANATFLNDVAPGGDGSIFFTDSGFDMGPDGLAPSGSDAIYRYIVGFLHPELELQLEIRLTADGDRTDIMPASERQLDGVEMLPDGGFLMSSWGDQCVYRIGGDGQVTRILEDVEAPADLGVDIGRNRVLVPLFNANQVMIQPLG